MSVFTKNTTKDMAFLPENMTKDMAFLPVMFLYEP